MKKLLAAAVVGTLLMFTGSTPTAKAAVYRRPYRPVVARPYAYRPGYRTAYGPYVYPYPYAYGYGYGYGYPWYGNGVYVGVPGLNLRIGR